MNEPRTGAFWRALYLALLFELAVALLIVALIV